MSSLLANAFREKVSKMKDPRIKAEAEFEVYYPTGFLPFDFMCGNLITVNANGINSEYYSVGIQDGSINMVIGRSGCGKTTWAVQAAANIVRRFDNAYVLEDTIEGGITKNRREVLTGFKGDELKDRWIVRNTGITIENVYERIKIIHDDKLENRDDYLYDTGLYDTRGQKIYKLEPTVYIIDSLSLLMPEKFTEEDEMSGNMSATASARAIAGFFRRIVPLLKMANIIIFVINHINQKVETNMFKITKSQISYLKQGETLPGGNTPIYLSDTVIRFDDSSKLKSDKDLGIDGSIVDVSILKSRATRVNQYVPLVFEFNRGFDHELSLFIMLKNAGKIKGAGAWFYIEGSENLKFAQRNFKQELANKPELRKAFIDKSIEVLKEKISTSENVEQEEDTYISDSILIGMNHHLLSQE